MIDNEEKKACEQEKAGVQLGRDYTTESKVASDDDIKESVELINPDEGTKDRG